MTGQSSKDQKSQALTAQFKGQNMILRLQKALQRRENNLSKDSIRYRTRNKTITAFNKVSETISCGLYSRAVFLSWSFWENHIQKFDFQDLQVETVIICYFQEEVSLSHWCNRNRIMHLEKSFILSFSCQLSLPSRVLHFYRARTPAEILALPISILPFHL